MATSRERTWVPKITFTPAEMAKIRSILDELDPATHDLTSHYAATIPPEDWNYVLTYIRKELISFVLLSSMARSIADVATERGLADTEGVKDFLTSRTWTRNFGVADDADDRFLQIASATGRPSPTSNYELATDADTLMEIAEERLLGTLDDEYAELVRRMQSL
jgi:hypothetical protein